MIKIEKIDNKSILNIAKKCLEQKKNQKIASSIFIKFFIGISVALGIINLFINPIDTVSSILSATTVFISSMSLKNTAKNTINCLYNEIICIVNSSIVKNSLDRDNSTVPNRFFAISSINAIDCDKSVDIVPANIKVGEDLEGVDAIPIFKEGKYVIVKSSINPYFIRVVEDEKGEEQEYLMEPIDEDIETLEEELPTYEECIKMLRL